jgi:cellobiose-specific phosphotransferase system component IIA
MKSHVRSRLEKGSWIAGIIAAVIAAVTLAVMLSTGSSAPTTQVNQTAGSNSTQIGSVQGPVTIGPPSGPSAPPRSVVEDELAVADTQDKRLRGRMAHKFWPAEYAQAIKLLEEGRTAFSNGQLPEAQALIKRAHQGLDRIDSARTKVDEDIKNSEWWLSQLRSRLGSVDLTQDGVDKAKDAALEWQQAKAAIERGDHATYRAHYQQAQKLLNEAREGGRGKY